MAVISRSEMQRSTLGDGMESWVSENGGMAVAFYRIRKGFDPSPLYKGLPGDMCPCTHWGYIIKGKIKMRTMEGEETVEGGQAFYFEPGHLGEILEDTEMVEFTPAGEYRDKSDHIAKAIQANI